MFLNRIRTDLHIPREPLRYIPDLSAPDMAVLIVGLVVLDIFRNKVVNKRFSRASIFFLITVYFMSIEGDIRFKDNAFRVILFLTGDGASSS